MNFFGKKLFTRVFLVFCLHSTLFILCFLKESYEALLCSYHILSFLVFEALCSYKKTCNMRIIGVLCNVCIAN